MPSRTLFIVQRHRTHIRHPEISGHRPLRRALSRPAHRPRPRFLHRNTDPTLRAGRLILSKKCVQCHDLRTILARPQTPESWRLVVARMAERSVILNRISEPEELAVTAYLIAVSPELQRSAKQQRAEALAAEQARDAAASLSAVALRALPRPGQRATPAPQRAHLPEASASVDLSRARGVFGTKCALCHPLKVVEAAPPASEREARELLARMVK